MKKAFSLILAVAMVLSLSAVAFAYQTADDTNEYITEKIKDVYCYGYVNGLESLSSSALTPVTGALVFGKTYYMPIIANYGAQGDAVDSASTIANPGVSAASVYTSMQYATFAKQVGSLTVTAKWTEGGEFVSDVGIKEIFVYKDNDNTVINRNIYAIYSATTGDATKEKSIIGEITVTGKAGSGALANKVDTTIPLDYKIYYDTTTVADKSTEVNGTLSLTRTGSDKFDKCEYTLQDKVTTVSLNGGDIKATLEGENKGNKYLISYNTIDDEAICAANPDAAIMFYNVTFNFRENAEVVVKAMDEEADNYLYQILPSGTVKDLTSTYSAEDGEFTFSARKLAGTYILADKPLVLG